MSKFSKDGNWEARLHGISFMDCGTKNPLLQRRGVSVICLYLGPRITSYIHTYIHTCVCKKKKTETNFSISVVFLCKGDEDLVDSLSESHHLIKRP